MSRRIALIHAMQGSIAPTRRAFEAVWPSAVCQNICDDSLSVDVGVTGLDAAMDKRFLDLVDYAVSCNVDGSATAVPSNAFHASFPRPSLPFLVVVPRDLPT